MDHRSGKATIIRIAPFMIAVLGLGLAGCTNPYDPVQRGLGGGILGAASGAAIGAAAGGGPGAALGAAIGGATGIFGGVATTPPPGTYYGYPAYGYPLYGYPAYPYPAVGYRGHPLSAYGPPGYSDPPGYQGPRAYEYQGGAGYPAHPGPPVYGSPEDLARPPYPDSAGYGYQSPPFYPPKAGSSDGSPVYGYGYPGGRSFEDRSPEPGIVSSLKSSFRFLDYYCAFTISARATRRRKS